MRMIYQGYLTGKSANQIAKDLTISPIYTMRGNKAWNNKTISTNLKNHAYKGDLLYQKRYTKDTLKRTASINYGELPQYLIENHHPAIIDNDLWENVQEEIAQRNEVNGVNKRGINKKHHRQEFFQTFSCSECGSDILHAQRKKKDRVIHSWRCKSSFYKDPLISCKAPSTREETMEHVFMKMLQEMKVDGSFKDEVIEIASALRLSKEDAMLLEVLEEKLQNKYKELYDIVEEGNKTGEDAGLIKEFTDAIMELQTEINKLNEQNEKADEILKELNWLIKELDELATFDPRKERVPFRGDIFSRIIENGVVYPDGKIAYNLKLGISRTSKSYDKQEWRLSMRQIDQVI